MTKGEGGKDERGKCDMRVKNIDFISDKNALHATIRRSIRLQRLK